MPAAKAALAAHRQGKFWEYHDLIFANQRALSEDKLVEWAKQLGLDVDKFNKDRKDPAIAEKINRDMAEGRKAGLRGTPTIYLNGRKFQPPGGPSVAALKAVIDSEFLHKKK